MATYIKIATVTVGAGGQAAMEFTSIPSTYTDLKVVYSTRCDGGGQYAIRIGFNNSTANFTNKDLQGAGSGTPSSSSSARLIGVSPGPTYTASTFANGETYIPNYASSANKSFSSDNVTENNATTSYADLCAGLWSDTSAINKISITLDSPAIFVQYSTATLYGISKS